MRRDWITDDGHRRLTYASRATALRGAIQQAHAHPGRIVKVGRFNAKTGRIHLYTRAWRQR